MLRVIPLGLSLVSVSLAAQVVVGTVTNSATRTGIAGAHVRLFAVGNPPSNQGYSAITDSEGRFRIEGVEEAAYRARFTATGYSSAPNAGDILPAFVVTQGDEPMRLATIELRQLATLHGRVLDASRTPVPSAVVWLIKGNGRCQPPICFPEHRSLTTDQKGEYAADDIAPGAWLVSATAPPDWKPPSPRPEQRLGWAQTFYPGVGDAQLAEPATLKSGEQWIPDIELTAAAMHRISGKLFDERGNPVPHTPVTITENTGPSRTEATNDKGAFEFWAVDNKWRISAALEKNGTKLKAEKFVDVRGRDTNNIDLSLAASLSLYGKLITKVPEGIVAPKPPPVDLVLVSTATLLSDGVDAFIPVGVNNGDVTVNDIYPGTYILQSLSESPAPFYLDSVQLGDSDATESMTLSSNGQPLTITYQLGGGTVRGSVKDCGTAHPLLIPQEPALRRNGFVRAADCDTNGRFEFGAVRPGRYFVLAAEGGPSFYTALFRDEQLLNNAGTITVQKNDSTSVDISLIIPLRTPAGH